MLSSAAVYNNVVMIQYVLYSRVDPVTLGPVETAMP